MEFSASNDEWWSQQTAVVQGQLAGLSMDIKEMVSLIALLFKVMITSNDSCHTKQPDHNSEKCRHRNSPGHDQPTKGHWETRHQAYYNRRGK